MAESGRRNIITCAGLLWWYCILYPILPSYFIMPGIGAIAFILNLIVIGVIVCCNARMPGKLINKTEVTFFVFSVCMIFLNVYHGAVFSAFWFAVTMPVTFLTFAQHINTTQNLDKIIDGIIVAAAILSVLAIIETLTGFNIFMLLNNSGAAVLDIKRMGLFRAKSFTYQAITFGNYLLLVSVLCVYRIVNCDDAKRIKKFKRMYILLWMAVFCTISRSSIIFFVLCQILLGLALGFGKLIKKIVVVIACLVVVYIFYFKILGNDDSFIRTFTYMLLSVFDESYGAEISGVANAAGNRTDLYKWIWDATQGHRIMGMGPSSVFSHDITYGSALYSATITKTSIEVEYLKCLYHYGFVGLILKVIFMITLLVSCLKNGMRDKRTGQKKLSLELALGIGFLVYFLSFFTVMQDTESRTFYIMVFIFFAYQRINRRMQKEEIK